MSLIKCDQCEERVSRKEFDAEYGACVYCRKANQGFYKRLPELPDMARERLRDMPGGGCFIILPSMFIVAPYGWKNLAFKKLKKLDLSGIKINTA